MTMQACQCMNKDGWWGLKPQMHCCKAGLPFPDDSCQAYPALRHQIAGSVDGVGWRRVGGRLGMR